MPSCVDRGVTESHDRRCVTHGAYLVRPSTAWISPVVVSGRTDSQREYDIHPVKGTPYCIPRSDVVLH